MIYVTISKFTVSARMVGAGDLMIGLRAVVGASQQEIDPMQVVVNLYAWGQALNASTAGVALSLISSDFYRQSKARIVIQNSLAAELIFDYRRLTNP